jgi:transcriptional regulator with XRE-family HTH domain
MKQTPFSTKLIELRKQHKFTQKFVGNKIGLSARQYAYLEYGNLTCGYWAIIKLCELYNISANELFGISKMLVFPSQDEN